MAEQAAGVQRREGRTAQDGGVRPPWKARARGRRQRMPVGVGLRRLEVAREIGGVQAGVQTGLDFRVPGPDVAQQDRRAVGVDAQRLGVQVALGVAGQRIGDHKWRRHQEPQLQIRMHAAGEVPVARQDGHGPDLASLRGPGHAFGQRTGIADAGGAAVAYDVEADGGQIVHQPGAAQVAGGGGRARPQRGLDPGRGGQSARACLARQQAGRDQQRRVRGVGAAGDRGDGHGIGRQAVRRAGARGPLAASAAGTPASGSRSCGRRGPAAWLAMPSSAMVMVRV